MARMRVEVSMIMGAPREIVFEAFTNEFNDWSVGKYTVSNKILKKEGNTIEREVVRKFCGMKIKYREREELTIPSMMIQKAENDILDVTIVVGFESEPDGSTRMNANVDGEIKGRLARVFGPVAGRGFHRDLMNVANKFAQYKGWAFRVEKSSSG